MSGWPKLTFALGVLVVVGGTALAQPAPPPPGAGGSETGVRMKTVGGDLAVFIPLGDASNGIDFGIGALVRVEIPVAPQIVVTGRLGYLTFTGTPSGVSLSDIPIYGGLRYDLTPDGNGVFLLAEAGVNHLAASVDGVGSNSDDKFGVNFGGGFQSGKVSARGEMAILDTGNSSSSYGILISGGYDFAAF